MILFQNIATLLWACKAMDPPRTARSRSYFAQLVDKLVFPVILNPFSGVLDCRDGSDLNFTNTWMSSMWLAIVLVNSSAKWLNGDCNVFRRTLRSVLQTTFESSMKRLNSASISTPADYELGPSLQSLKTLGTSISLTFMASPVEVSVMVVSLAPSFNDLLCFGITNFSIQRCPCFPPCHTSYGEPITRSFLLQ